MNKYAFKVRLCEGYQCDGHIMIEADNEDMAYDMALDYVCEKLYSALPELNIDVGVEVSHYLTRIKGEEWLVKEIEEAKQYCIGEVELNLFEHEEYGNCWYAMDYRQDLQAAVQIDNEKYKKPLITQSFAEEYDIDVIHCCDECHIYYVG